MKPEDFKYTIEIRLENISYDELERLKKVLHSMDTTVQYKEFNKTFLTQAQKTSI